MRLILSLLLVFGLGTTALAQDIEGSKLTDQDGGLWLPVGASDYTAGVDFMYNVIFYVTLGMFILVEGLIIIFCIIYRRRPGHRPMYTHGSHKAEITWTVVPALMLLGLAVWQIPYWNNIKLRFPKPDEPHVTQVHFLGQQFKWNVRYPGSKEWVKKAHSDFAEDVDFDASNLSNLHLPMGDRGLLHLRSADVIHSIFIPHMRVKQDTVPGLRNRVWFRPNRIMLIDLKNKDEKGNQKRRWVDLPEWYQEDDDKGHKALTYAKPPDFEFMDPSGAYYDKRVAVSAVSDYAEIDGVYDVYRPGGTPKQVKVLHQGKLLADEDVGTEDWSSCDYALGIFEIACAELCGAEHFTMRGFLVVEPRIVYEDWLLWLALDTEEAPVWKYWRD